MAGGGFLNKSRRGPEQQDAHVKTDKLALQAGMRQQHREGSDTGPRAGDRGEILGALARGKAGQQSKAFDLTRGGKSPGQLGIEAAKADDRERASLAKRNQDSVSSLLAHGDSDPSKHHAYGAHKG